MQLGVLVEATVLLLVAFQCPTNHAHKILVLVPYSGQSHWYIFRPLLEELLKRGNHVTVLSHYPRISQSRNYTDINIATAADPGVHTKNVDSIGRSARVREMLSVLMKGVEKVCEEGLRHPNVQRLLHSNESYDVVITEIFNADCFLGFVHKFQAPMVAIRTAPLSPWTNYRVGNPDNPSYIPNSLLGKVTRMPFWDRVENLLGVLFYKGLYGYFNADCTKIARRHFGDGLPELTDIAMNTSMILVNSHFVAQYGRPFVSAIREIGGIHIKKPEKLPKEFEDWIAGAKHGVIYFSLGSMLKSSSMSEFKRRALLDAFSELPQRILMKWEDDGMEQGTSLKKFPSNVKIFQWAPQYDILCHPNVRIFISHAGMLSTLEAVYSGTPMIAIPAFGDQPTNAALLQEKDFAIVVEYPDITKDVILQAIRKILQSATYQKRASEMSRAIRDRPLTPVEEAAYWVEYVARHKGAPFLRSPAVDMPLYKYLLLDVIAFLFLSIIIILVPIWLLIRSLLRIILQKSSICSRKNKTE